MAGITASSRFVFMKLKIAILNMDADALEIIPVPADWLNCV
jgi:hypothetical protein